MNHELSVGTITATVPVLPVTRLAACRDTAKLRSRAACSTRARTSGETVDSPRRVRETVEVETPARSATSAIVGCRC